MPSSSAPIETVLGLEPQGVLSLVGGGGKTSLMFHLAHSLAAAGKKVLTTTTTKIFHSTGLQSRHVLVEPDPQRLLERATQLLDFTGHMTAAAASLPANKLQGYPAEAIRLFRDSGLFDWIVVEADGSGRRPLKAPASHEPVIPDVTTVLVAVAGLEVLGQPLSEESVFRPELAAPIMGLQQGDIINPQALSRLFTHPSGSFKGAPTDARRFIFLNKADHAGRVFAAGAVAAFLRHDPKPAAVTLLVGQARHEIRVLAVHQIGGEP